MRDASPEIYQWDAEAGQTACTAQLLYMYEKLSLGDIPMLDRMIERESGRADMNSGNLKLILHLRFYVYELSPMDPDRLIGEGGQEYLRGFLIDQGVDEARVEEQLAEVYATTLERALRRQGMTRSYGEFYTHQVVAPDDAHLASMIARGWQVGAVMMQEDASPQHVLVLGSAGPGQCRLFNPAAPFEERITTVDRSALTQKLAPVLFGYYREPER